MNQKQYLELVANMKQTGSFRFWSPYINSIRRHEGLGTTLSYILYGDAIPSDSYQRIMANKRWLFFSVGSMVAENFLITANDVPPVGLPGGDRIIKVYRRQERLGDQIARAFHLYIFRVPLHPGLRCLFARFPGDLAIYDSCKPTGADDEPPNW